MPNIKGAKKRVRGNARKEKVNTLLTSSMRTAIKSFEKSVKDNSSDVSEKLNTAMQRIDKAKNHGLVHQNKAARVKSRLMNMKNKTK